VSELLESLLTPQQRAEADAADARQAQSSENIHPLFADILNRHAAIATRFAPPSVVAAA
jgi:hypothetical protein